MCKWRPAPLVLLYASSQLLDISHGTLEPAAHVIDIDREELIVIGWQGERLILKHYGTDEQYLFTPPGFTVE